MNNDQKHKRPADQEEGDSKIYFTENSTLQTPEEEQADKARKPSAAEDQIETHTLEDIDIDAIAQTDRAGTNDRKP